MWRAYNVVVEDSEDRPATRKDLNELERGMREMEDRLIEHMRDMQTEIIRVFMAFQERNENRMATMETALP